MDIVGEGVRGGFKQKKTANYPLLVDKGGGVTERGEARGGGGGGVGIKTIYPAIQHCFELSLFSV